MEKAKKRRSIGDNILIGLVIFALVIVLGVSGPLSYAYIMFNIRHLEEDVKEDSYLIAQLIDPEETLEYAAGRGKDSYYKKTLNSLKDVCDGTEISGCSVFIPDGDRWIYVWDVRQEGGSFDAGESVPADRNDDRRIKEELLNGDGDGDGSLSVTYSIGDKTIHSVYTPVYSDSGEAVAVVEVRYQHPDVEALMLQTMALVLMLTALITAAVMAVVYTVMRERIITPIAALTEGAEKIADNLDNTETVKLDVHTNDELETLAEAFTRMELDIREYIGELETVTAEKERLSTELELAAQIQKGVLPKLRPPFTDDDRMELFASMTPAKEVGGDFYDFFMIDDDHIALVIGDVSGKGIPAALFMVVSKVLIKYALKSGMSPGDALYDVNRKLLEGNEQELFVTVWLAVIDLASGRGVSVNAGHEKPALRRSGGEFELLKYMHSPMVAAFEEAVFLEREFTLGAGDTVFVYTDGATEAMRRNHEQFGEARLTETLNRHADDTPEELLTGVREAIDEFVGDAPQFDDLTMLAFRLKKTGRS